VLMILVIFMLRGQLTPEFIRLRICSLNVSA